MEELAPILCFIKGVKYLYFHRKKTDDLYKLKDKAKHNHLRMFGLMREIYVDPNDLVLVGKRSQLDDKIILH